MEGMTWSWTNETSFPLGMGKCANFKPATGRIYNDMKDFTSLFKNKRITIMGLGLLGRGLGDTIFLAGLGARVTVTDLKTADELAPSIEALKGLPIKFTLGEHKDEDFIHADMIIRNADVPKSSRFLAIARERNIPVEMDESLFCKIFKGRVVGVTGTRGKTTTTTLIHHILQKANGSAYLAGNIKGAATLPLLEMVNDDSIVTLELSSWQLQGFHDSKVSPNASVFTNIHPDHLNRYSGLEDYIEDKKAIYLYQKENDFCVFNKLQEETAKLAKYAPAGKAFFNPGEIPESWKIKLPGKHNLENVAAAITLTRQLNVDEHLIKEAVEEFPGVEHRLQWLGETRGVGFVNDTTSTTPVSGIAAVESLESRRILLIAGGADKKLDLTSYAEKITERVEYVALLEGTATEKLRRAIVDLGGSSKIIGTYKDLERATLDLFDLAKEGDVILLSPGCASFGLFANEFHRGEVFIHAVNRLIG